MLFKTGVKPRRGGKALNKASLLGLEEGVRKRYNEDSEVKSV